MKMEKRVDVSWKGSAAKLAFYIRNTEKWMPSKGRGRIWVHLTEFEFTADEFPFLFYNLY